MMMYAKETNKSRKLNQQLKERKALRGNHEVLTEAEKVATIDEKR